MAVLMLTMTACSPVEMLSEALSKDPISYEDLATIAEERGFVIQDHNDDITEEDEDVQNIYVLVKEDESYAIEFWEYDSEESAKARYLEIKEEIDSRYDKLVTTSNIEVSGPNYMKTAHKAIGNFTIVSYIDNTLVYVDIFNAEPDSLKEFLKSIGY